MRVEYWCQHCKHQIGAFDRPHWSKEEAERYCGLQNLSPVERSEWVSYDATGSTLSVRTICDHCQQAVERNPELLVEGKILQ